MKSKFNSDWFRRSKKTLRNSQIKFLENLNLFLQPQFVFDFGCCYGTVLEFYKSKGIEVLGIEGAAAAKNYIKIPFLIQDLRVPFQLETRADLVLCVQVLEFIEEEFSDISIENIVKHSKKWIYFSSTQHLLPRHKQVQPYSVWIEKFNKYRFSPEIELTQKIIKLSQTDGPLPGAYRHGIIFKKE